MLGWIKGFLQKFFPNLFKRFNGWLLAFITPLIAPFFEFITKLFRKVALFLLIVAAIGTAIVVFAKAVESVVGRIATEMAPADLIVFGQMFLPSNLAQGITILLFARLHSLVFMWVHRLTEKFIHT
ncbi:hypothetical protein [Pseudomonas sp. PA27(2017)]|uniref:hypothetical protein n=1 Tax=Pseudomonas sp. PA27(2017) TaxID=1932112 RepID=UPI00095F6C6E|nr:hypothetical protein [Pseudomonas sp. PA27(2017)]OLU34910.1 hypothetical protein BVH06_04630 [Pseudomonas sp. PA27(2017)]